MNTTAQTLHAKQLFVQTRQHKIFKLDKANQSHAQMYKKKGINAMIFLRLDLPKTKAHLLQNV
ncbi:hypothetical protein A9996_02490 [Gelidibacter algens]|nr:hypothetical protein A9996_02490 [Gelidibacter algens]